MVLVLRYCEVRMWVTRRDVFKANNVQEEDDREDLHDAVDLAHSLDLVPFVGHETRPPDGHWIGLATVHLNVCCLCGFAVWPLPVN